MYENLFIEYTSGVPLHQIQTKLLDILANHYRTTLDVIYATQIDYSTLEFEREMIEPLDVKRYVYGIHGNQFPTELDIPFILNALSLLWNIQYEEVPAYIETRILAKAKYELYKEILYLKEHPKYITLYAILPVRDAVLAYSKNRLNFEADYTTVIQQSIGLEHMLVDYYLLGEELSESLPDKMKYYYQDTYLWKTLITVSNVSYIQLSKHTGLSISDLLAIQKENSEKPIIAPETYLKLLDYLLKCTSLSLTYSVSYKNGELSGVTLHKIPIFKHPKSLPIFLDKRLLLDTIPSINLVDDVNKLFCGRPCLYIDMSFQFGFAHTKDTILMHTNS